jgi:glycosyltransferase involved in cell wall biosynthesis
METGRQPYGRHVSPNPGHRVLIVLNHLGTGGAEWQSMHLARGLAARGYRVTIVALGRVTAAVGPLEAAGVRILRLGAIGPRARLAALPTLTRLARGSDVVHCTNWDASLYGRVAALLARRPVTVTDHSAVREFQRSRRGAPRGAWVSAHHRVLAPLTAMTVACARAGEALLAREGVPRDRLVHIPNGVPIEELRARARGGPTRADLGIPDDALVIMHVAKFRPEKNHLQTLATTAALRCTLGDVRAVFVGHGPEEAEVRRRAEAMGAGWARFLGDRADVAALLTLADIAVLPSRAEAMPMIVLEAQALGVPVIAYDVGDVRPVLEATGGGVCVPALDADAFTAACERVLADAPLRARLARDARAGIVAFGADAMAQRYADLLDAVVAARRPPPPPLRVAHVGPDIAGRGGIPAVLRDLFASPLADAHRLEFIATYGTATYGEVDSWRRAAVFARGLLRLAAWCAGRGPRLVHVHTATRGSWYRKGLCVLVARALGRPVILHVHAGPGDVAAFCARLGPLRRWLLARAFGAATRVISVSAAGAREVERGLGVRGVAVVPNAAPLTRAVAPAAAVPTDADADAGVGVVYLGGFANAVKGGQVLVDALPALLDAAPGVSVSLAGLGAPPALDGPAGRVRWLGWMEEAPAAAALAGADIVVLPSLSEGLPVTLLEALVHGRPVVATRVGGMPEVITDDVDGVLVPPGDAAALAGAIAALAADPDRRRRLGRAARARAERLSHEEVYARLDSLYRELAPTTAAAPGR